MSVSKSEIFSDSFKECVNVFGGIDILINNAGVYNESQWEKEITVNVVSIFVFILVVVVG